MVVSFDYNGGSSLKIEETNIGIIQINSFEIGGKLIIVYIFINSLPSGVGP